MGNFPKQLMDKVVTKVVFAEGDFVMLVVTWTLLWKLTGILGLDKHMTGVRLMDWPVSKGLSLMDVF